MLKINSMVMMAAAAILMTGNCVAQNCGSCATASCGTSSCGTAGFGYPGADGCGSGSGHGNHRQNFEQLKEVNAKIAARNDAWPKPFDCADRQLYFSIWNPMISEGFHEQCVLSSEHFGDDNRLNQFGQTTVAGIMQNMPSTYKNVYVNRDADESVSDARMESVQSVVKTFYSQVAPNAQIAFSNKLPSSIPGAKAQGIQRLYSDAAPTPVIQISSGSETVTSSVGN